MSRHASGATNTTPRIWNIAMGAAAISVWAKLATCATTDGFTCDVLNRHVKLKVRLIFFRARLSLLQRFLKTLTRSLLLQR